MSQRRYLTTTLPYVNADPHLGFALELVQADTLARYYRLRGDEVFFNTGTDEHGVKIYRKALEAGQDPQAYVDGYAAKFGQLKTALNLSYDSFLRTTDPKHVAAAQEFWCRCAAAGDIYKKNYQIKYCVGCELEKTDSELVDGHCPLHPNLEIELIEEENYFFKFSKYRQALLDLYNQRPDFVVPNSRLNEITKFVERGLEDFSISRLKSKMPWGVPVPGDDEQVMYVWFDALVSYVSAIGWPQDEDNFKTWWPVIQFAGKDNLRQQAAMWQAMLMSASASSGRDGSAGLPTSQQIVIHGFITSHGQKMSKSLGNVVDPFKLIEDYGTDAVRYYLLRHVHPFEDSDFTIEKFKEAYNANLANGLGNLVSRVMKMAVTNKISYDTLDNPAREKDEFVKEYHRALDFMRFDQALDAIWLMIQWADRSIQQDKPFETIKTNRIEAESHIKLLLYDLRSISKLLFPLMPQTAEIIDQLVVNNQVPEHPLFPRKE